MKRPFSLAFLVFLLPLSSLAAPQSETPATARPVVEELQAEADSLAPLVTTDLAKAFLRKVEQLPEPTSRVIHRNKAGTRAMTEKEFAALPEEERTKEEFRRREFPPRFYYHTGYGSPLIFVRALDILATVDPVNWKPASMSSKRVIDFGCGTLGHLRLLASLGADATGIDVEPIFTALYSEPTDQGAVPADEGKSGNVRLLTGRWPAEQPIADAIRTHAKGEYDLFISKNTLKRGYIHPARETDPARLVNLGVDDATFVKAVYDTLKPGGVFMIYNIAPAQAPDDQPYLPHADGKCPFDRELLEKGGFEVVKYDEDDQRMIVEYWQALGINQGKPDEEMKKELFAWWTVCRKPVKQTASTGK